MADKLARGIWPALVTPFTDDGSALAPRARRAARQAPDRRWLKRLLRLRRHGVREAP